LRYEYLMQNGDRVFCARVLCHVLTRTEHIGAVEMDVQILFSEPYVNHPKIPYNSE